MKKEKKRRKTFLLIAPLPPPIGGVTMHTSRLLDQIEASDIPCSIGILKRDSLFLIFQKIMKNNVIHLHTSNIMLQFCLALFCFFSRKIFIFTKHGNIAYLKGIKRILLKETIRFAQYPIVLNEECLTYALQLNKNAKMISAFIPPSKEDALFPDLQIQLGDDRKKYRHLFMTNAYQFVMDRKLGEIYGIFDLVELFRLLPDECLYISNPTGKYMEELHKRKLTIPGNVRFINYPHSFFEVLKFGDVMIRNTTTDGDAISIKEALFLKRKVLATSVVSRPMGVIKYDTIGELQNMIISIDSMVNKDAERPVDGSKLLIELYKQCLADVNYSS